MQIRAGVTIILVILAGSVRAASDAPPDTVLFNARVFTADVAKPRAEALAIRGGRIVAVGSTQEIQHIAAANTKRIDLHGATVIPGINDAHYHVSIQPDDTVEIEMQTRDPTWPQLREALSASIAKSPRDSLLLAYMGPTLFRDPAVSRLSLDAIAPTNPVVIITLTGHAAFLNSAALARFGVSEAQEDPLGGRYERDGKGELTGVLREYAVMQLERRMADSTPDEVALRELKEQLGGLSRFGITSLQDMSNQATPERAARLLASVPTSIRVRVVQMAIPRPAGLAFDDGPAVSGTASPKVTVSGRKWMLDGVPLKNTFAPRLPQAGAHDDIEDSIRNLPLLFSGADMASMLKDTQKSHQQLLLHVSGSRGAKIALEELKALGGASAWAGRRVRFEHGDGLLPDLLPEAKAFGIVVVQNPSHFAAIKSLYGVTLSSTQPLKSLLNAQIPLAFGSDGVSNPYLNVLFASTHPARPTEAISREEAITAYTLGSAYAEFAENDKGSLSVGKLADLAVLSQDIFSVSPSELPKTQATITMVDGKIVYQR